MRIGDTPPPSAMSPVKGNDEWNNGDRALLHVLIDDLYNAASGMSGSSQKFTKESIDNFKSTLEEFRNHLMNKLPPDVDHQIDETLSNLDEIFKDVLDPEKNMNAVNKLFDDLDSIKTIVKSWM